MNFFLEKLFCVYFVISIIKVRVFLMITDKFIKILCFVNLKKKIQRL